MINVNDDLLTLIHVIKRLLTKHLNQIKTLSQNLIKGGILMRFIYFKLLRINGLLRLTQTQNFMIFLKQSNLNYTNYQKVKTYFLPNQFLKANTMN